MTNYTYVIRTNGKNLIYFFFLFCFFFVFPFLLPCTWDWWGEKHTETNTSPFLSQLLIHVYKMFMQTTDIHCPKAMGAHPTDTKRSTKISGQKRQWQGIRSYKKSIRKYRQQWIGHHSHSSLKDAHHLPWDRNFKKSYDMRHEPKWLKGIAISLFNSCKENWNKICQNQGILSHKHKPKPLSSQKHSPCIPTHPPFPQQPPTTTAHKHPHKNCNIHRQDRQQTRNFSLTCFKNN